MWLPHVAGRTGSGRIHCGSARSGQACAKGADWPGARDPSDPLQPHRRVGRRAKENPHGVLGEAAGVRSFAPKARRSEKGFAGGEVWRRPACTGLSVQEET
jgi:hypothetical protein